MSIYACDILLRVAEKLIKGLPAQGSPKAPRHKVLLRQVTAPDAQLRLEQALELLLAESPEKPGGDGDRA